MNVIRETVRVVKEEIEKGGRDKCYDLKFSSTGEIGQSTISEYLGGPWLREYQINLIAEGMSMVGEEIAPPAASCEAARGKGGVR